MQRIGTTDHSSGPMKDKARIQGQDEQYDESRVGYENSSFHRTGF